jgi:hypothetical protein
MARFLSFALRHFYEKAGLCQGPSDILLGVFQFTSTPADQREANDCPTFSRAARAPCVVAFVSSVFDARLIGQGSPRPRIVV